MKGIFAPKDKTAILTVPNIITLSGFVFTGLYVWSFLSGLATWKIFSFLFLAGISDTLDGFFARYLKQETFCGAILDPVRDRALMLGILWSAWYIDQSEFVVVAIAVILALELGCLALNFSAIDSIEAVTSHFSGKARQAGHLVFAVFIVLRADIGISLMGMMVFSVFALYGAMIAKLAKDKEGEWYERI